MTTVIAKLQSSPRPRTAAAAAAAAAQLLGKAGADEVAEPPRTELAGRVGATAAKPLIRQHP